MKFIIECDETKTMTSSFRHMDMTSLLLYNTFSTFHEFTLTYN